MPSAPLADRLRPQRVEDMVGQQHLLGKNMVLRRIIDQGECPNMIFYGPSGIGKTTLASIIAQRTNKALRKLNATTASTADIKAIIDETEMLSATHGILLYLDEIQYFNKKQQQTLLEYIENGKITLIASTTENPYFCVYGAILSRSTVFEFKPVTWEETVPAIRRAFAFVEQEQNRIIRISDEAVEYIAQACGGDVRKSMNTVELCALAAPLAEDGSAEVTMETVKQLAQKSAMRYDRDGDSHYDILSAFQKSMRGSDPDAAIHYLARLLEAGDLTSACRRLLVCCCEDVGLAYPGLIPIVKACVDAALQVGLPEAQIPLADAVILVCTSPKSNTGVNAINMAMDDLKRKGAVEIPAHLRDAHYGGAKKMGHGLTYQYPHDFPNHWTPQQYLPDALKDAVYYEFGDNKTEQSAKAYWDKVKHS